MKMKIIKEQSATVALAEPLVAPCEYSEENILKVK
jgi:hypothetical protein